MPGQWKLFILFLGIFVFLYIIMSNRISKFTSEIIMNNYIMEWNISKLRLPKPVWVPVKEFEMNQSSEVAPTAMKIPTSLTLNTMRTRKNDRPRSVIDYEKRQKDLCKNTWQEEYIKLHQLSLETNANKFIIYKSRGGGWGNQLRDLLDLFHFAVIAKRAFLILCSSSLPLEGFLVPRSIKWNHKVNETHLSVRLGQKVILNDMKDPPDPSEFDKILNYSVEYSPQLFGQTFKFIASNLKYDLPVWPNLRQMNGCSFYYLFKKSDILQQRLNQWKENLGFHTNIVIAIHIRLGDSVFQHNRGDKRFKDMKNVDLAFECASQIQKEIEKKYRSNNVVWFLASDSEKVKTNARKNYGSKVKYITGPIEHIGHPRKGNEYEGLMSMLVDFFLLRDADYRIYPGPSTFDNAVDYVTLGVDDVSKMFSKRGHPGICVIPPSLKT